MSSTFRLDIIVLLKRFATETVSGKDSKTLQINYNKIIYCLKAHSEKIPSESAIRKWFNLEAHPAGHNLEIVSVALMKIYFPDDYELIQRERAVEKGKEQLVNWAVILEELIEKNPYLLDEVNLPEKDYQVSVYKEIVLLLEALEFREHRVLLTSELLPFFKENDSKINKNQAVHLYEILKMFRGYLLGGAPKFYLHMDVFSTKKIGLFELFLCLRKRLDLADISLCMKSLEYYLEINKAPIKVVEISDLMRLPDRLIMNPVVFKDIIAGTELENNVGHPGIEDWSRYPSPQYFRYIAILPPYSNEEIGGLYKIKLEITGMAKLIAGFSDAPNHCVISCFIKIKDRHALIITSSKSDKTNLDFFSDTPVVEKDNEIFRYYGSEATKPSSETPTHWEIHQHLSNRTMEHAYVVHLHNNNILSKASHTNNIGQKLKLLSINYLPYGTLEAGAAIAQKISKDCKVVNVRDHGQWYLGKKLQELLDLVKLTDEYFAKISL